MYNITIWDLDARRMSEICSHLHHALIVKKIKAKVTCNSEAPLIARMQLSNRVPLIEINSNFWSTEANRTISFENLCDLLEKIVEIKEI